MSQPIISVKNISKKYNITHQQGGYVALRDVLTNIAKSPFAFLKHKAKQAIGKAGKEEFWALKDINFEVNKGEAIGIIGANGAGKSTLLKILTGITPPTTGEIIMRGKVASLLEVGTGFHPELTGRENVFLNGAIMGMGKKEISDKFNSIVEFAGIKKFIDTPVKRYSSGMYVRLAFAVASHMEPDILLVDEVLAVGDAEFQKKCLGKMDEVTKQAGRTILFVSHNMGAIQKLCKKCILLNKGEIINAGPTQNVINAYLHSEVCSAASKEWTDITKAPGNDIVRLCAVRVKQKDKITNAVDIRLPVGIEMEYEVIKPGLMLSPNYHFLNEDGVYAFVSGNQDPEWQKKSYQKGKYISTAWIHGNFLSEGTMMVGAAITTFNPTVVHFFEQNAVSFRVIDSFDGSSARGDYMGAIPGVVRPILRWTTQFNEINNKV
ncbi:ATP-binding cassette domain-containing protein [Candidatus Falkowbacteria bacterium]|nr:ATP-binding cassette domain-containing protein [Candidatus Falkowbacteria bacterium]MCG2697631.1 polysaccharide ABC transporter ATP-binding protein [Candidatus Parcubacteria bacterium]